MRERFGPELLAKSWELNSNSSCWKDSSFPVGCGIWKGLWPLRAHMCFS